MKGTKVLLFFILLVTFFQIVLSDSVSLTETVMLSLLSVLCLIAHILLEILGVLEKK